MLEIGINQGGDDAEVRLGEPFMIRLAENPTTGYRWHLRPNPHDAIAIEDDRFEPPGGPHGAPGVHCWRCRATRVGNVAIEVERRRSWEKTSTEVVTLRIRVVGE